MLLAYMLSHHLIRDGTVSIEEFFIYTSITAPSTGEPDPIKIVELTFMMYDQDGDGLLNQQELEEGLCTTLRQDLRMIRYACGYESSTERRYKRESQETNQRTHQQVNGCC